MPTETMTKRIWESFGRLRVVLLVIKLGRVTATNIMRLKMKSLRDTESDVDDFKKLYPGLLAKAIS